MSDFSHPPKQGPWWKDGSRVCVITVGPGAGQTRCGLPSQQRKGGRRRGSEPRFRPAPLLAAQDLASLSVFLCVLLSQQPSSASTSPVKPTPLGLASIATAPLLLLDSVSLSGDKCTPATTPLHHQSSTRGACTPPTTHSHSLALTHTPPPHNPCGFVLFSGPRAKSALSTGLSGVTLINSRRSA